MSGRNEVNPSQTKVPRILSLEEVHELERGNAILQLQRDIQSLTTSLIEVLTKFLDDPGGGMWRERGQQRDDPTLECSSSS